VRDRRALAVGTCVFLALAPLLAGARQAMLLLVAWALGAGAALLESHLLPQLPVDPVYGGASLRVLGGIEPRGLAVAGWPGRWLHALAPAVFGSPGLVADGAAVSALVDPGLTVLARVLAAVLATSALVTLTGLAAGRLRHAPLAVAARLGQVWLLLDLARETNLSLRDLEATGLPFALAALTPVDAHGQRVLLTGQLDGVPQAVVGGANALLAMGGCLVLAWLTVAAVRQAWAVARLLARPRRLARLTQVTRPCWPTWPHLHASHSRLPSLTPATLVNVGAAGARRIARPAGLTILAVTLNLTPLRTLAEGEIAIVPAPVAERAGTMADDLLAEPAPQPAPPTPVVVTPALATSAPATSVPVAAASPAPATPSSPTGTRVTLEGSNYRYTLRVNGQPWVVRGMGYNPWYANLSTAERQARYRRDFSLMRETGINTLEGWFQQQFDETTLDEAHRQGLKVIMPFELNQDYDYADPAIQARFRAEVTAWVLRYRDHPAVLMWGPGNEVLHRLIFPTAVQGRRDPARERRADDFARFYVELMDLIHKLDPNHPVLYRDAEDLYLARFLAQLQQRPEPRPWFVYGTNVYTSRIAEVIARWPSRGLDAPLLVSEFSPGGAGESDRPRMLGWYWSTIRAHPERVLGGVVYTWATRGPEDLDRVFGLTDESGAPIDGSLRALRQLFRPASPVPGDPT
jgi:hypothetical protein